MNGDYGWQARLFQYEYEVGMRRALGSIIKKCQESSNDVILSSQRDLKQFCSLNHVNLMSALMYPLSSQLIIVMALEKIYLNTQ